MVEMIKLEDRTPLAIHKEILPAVNNGASYIDALVEYAERNGIEIETLGAIIKKSGALRDKIWTEAIETNNIDKKFVESSLEDFV